MAASFILLAVMLLASVAVGLYRVSRGPTPTDTMLAALLIGTTGTAIALLLASALGIPRALDVALTLSVLAAIIGVAFVRCGWPEDPS
jgi:multicomponent Na+:H+ antiporter subunit F